MKKLLILTILLIGALGWSQDRPIRADVVFLDTLTTTERNALTMRPSQFALIANSTVDSVQAWIVDKWVNLGSTGGGETYTFGTGLTNTSGTITVTNPFEEADETKLDGIDSGATVGADWNTNLTNIPADIADGDDDTIADGSETKLSEGTNVTITGTGTTGSPYVINSTASGTGDVTAASAFGTDNRLIKSDGTGKGVQSTEITIDDTNNVSGLANVLPDGNGTRDLGSVSFPWLNVYANNLRFISGIGSSISLTGSMALDTFLEMQPTDTQPANFEGRFYADDSENRPKYYDGTSWKAFLLAGDASGTDDQTASEVTITDSGDNFTATDVEGALAELAVSGGSGTDDQNANEVPYDNSTSGLTATDVQAAIDEVVASGGGSTTYSPPVINSLNGDADFTAGNANIHSGANTVINQLSAAETIKIALSNANAGEVDVYRFDLNNASGQLDFTSANGFVANGFSGNAVRLDGIGEVDFIETGVNTGVFKVLPGSNVSYVTLDLTAPSISSAVVENSGPSEVVVTYNEALDPSFVPATTQYTINDPSANTITSVGVSGSTVTLGLTNSIENGDTVTLGYSQSGTALRDLAGNLAGSISGYSVTNNVASSSNLHTQANAANPDNEANATTGWSIIGSTSVTSIADTGSNGSYAIQGTATTATTNAGIRYSFTAVSGRQYRITWDDRSTLTTGGVRAVLWTGVTSGPSIAVTSATYTSRSVDVTANATTIQLNWYLSTFGTSTVNGTNVIIDNLVITDITP